MTGFSGLEKRAILFCCHNVLPYATLSSALQRRLLCPLLCPKTTSHAMSTIRLLGLLIILVSTSASAKVVHYPPTSSNLNNLNFVLNGSGTPGIFNSSLTSEKEYGIYNWCNMPHVRSQEYKCVYSGPLLVLPRNHC